MDFRERQGEDHMRAGQAGMNLSDDLPPGRRALAEVLGTLYGHLGRPTLAHTADQLAERHYRKHPSEISRYLCGLRVPPLNFVHVMYDLAVERVGAEAIAVTRQIICDVHAKAEPVLCKSCHRLRSQNRSLRDTAAQLRGEKAGLEAALADAQKQLAALPVPSDRGDRQRSAFDMAAARQIADRASRFHDQGNLGAALSLLRETAGVLTPLESAASLVVLRHRERNDLADSFLQMYGRDQPGTDVMRVALELHDYGLPDDAGALLRAALD
ncbi:hypothetical protein AABB02_19280 [Streptomyces rimosus]|uniref:hypothetical protein n=1 Tax=Streptomyces rimosus TaxID=1927 RepID=UPI0031E1FCBD